MKRSIATGVVLAFALSLPAWAQDHKIGEPGVTAPKLIYKIDPEYTEEARAAKISGTVILNVVIDESGIADSIKVTRSLDEGLDQKAIEVVRRWRFVPGMKDGKAVRLNATIEVNFRLQ